MTIPTKWAVLRLKWGEDHRSVYLDPEYTTEFYSTGDGAQDAARNLAERKPGELFAVAEITGVFVGRVKVEFETP